VVFGLVAAGTASADSAIVREPRPVAAFHAISVPGTIQVIVTIGKAASVELSGEADLLPKVTTTVKDGVLVLDTPRRMNNRKSKQLRAIVTMPELKAVEIGGTAELKATGLASANLRVDIQGTGSITLSGTAGTMEVSIDGTGEVDADKLAAEDARVAIGGTGQATLRASKSVEVNVSGTGSVDIAGNPARVKKSVTGTGSVHVH
jgi:hypothetical protein